MEFTEAIEIIKNIVPESSAIATNLLLKFLKTI